MSGKRHPVLNWPIYGREEIEIIKKTFAAREWGGHIGGRNRLALKEAFAEYHGAKYAVLTSSGTSALEIALRAAGVNLGDEVILQPYTCIADVDAIISVGGIPIFVDINPDTLCLDLNLIKKAATKRTKAILAIHYAGNVMDIESINKLARPRGISVIEDACLAHGAEWKGRKIGTFGRLSCFSLGSHKLMTVGEGGIILTNDRKLAEVCRSIGDHGRTNRGVDKFGWNYRMPELLAGIALVQLKRYPSEIKKRNINARYLDRELSKIKGIKTLRKDPRITLHGYGLYVFRIIEEEFGMSKGEFLEAMAAEGVQWGYGYRCPLYKEPLFKKDIFKKECFGYAVRPQSADYSRVYCPESERACKEVVWLEPYDLLGSKDDMQAVVKAVKKVRGLAKFCS